MTMSRDFPDKTWADHFAEIDRQKDEGEDGGDNE